ncbi:hypothetical protein AA0242T_1090 [Acetobacter aceti NRIC 0242]|uniref:Uncharacterized protein n=1 Tax=Acetobacter aceti NBRC 14818 TaxID=887700 RepID=A0AB33II40_ACEAC|nr:hypothetical protein EDC15_107102 [Acetobacter aceti NBRC 14818]BCK77587.1 hypothetical protein EMQ_3193 [Acetobacter aceti NBRC 14818]GAN56774.1 hypothetical protein Abac_010_048 [Acetobacter aceti NBRC 14818]GBO80388.1 hypothetical protein AA0242T_1090 [Acetobacter aceti NRIC 0242]
MDCREITRAKIAIPSLVGLWRRSLIEWDDGKRDESTKVFWLQGRNHFIDLRQPASLPRFPDRKCRDDLTYQDCLALSCQEGFAGHLQTNGDAYEWVRMVDYQPVQSLPDVGFLHWQNATLIETGKDLPYTEHWHREKGFTSSIPLHLQLEDRANGCRAVFLMVGRDFMFARNRTIPMPAGMTLHETVSQASNEEHARQLVDCEISFGKIAKAGGPLIIHNSTLPWKTGTLFQFDLSGETIVTIPDIAPNGKNLTRRWHRVHTEGND